MKVNLFVIQVAMSWVARLSTSSTPRCISQRASSGIAFKVQPTTPDSPLAHKTKLEIPKTHIFNTESLMRKYFETPKTHPDLIYDFTDDLQLVKPYTVSIKNNLRLGSERISLHDFTARTMNIPLPNNLKYQFINRHLASGRVLVDGKVMPGDKPLLNKSTIVTKHHRHEWPVPRFDPALLEPQKRSRAVGFVDKPPGFPCVTANMTQYAYNSLQFMLLIYSGISYQVILFNDIGFASGIVIFSRSKKNCVNLYATQKEINLKFVYYVNVTGHFDRDTGENLAATSNIIETVDVVGYSIETDSTVLRLQCGNVSKDSLYHIRKSLSAAFHPVVNDWNFLKQHGGVLTGDLSVGLGKGEKSLFSGRKLIQNVKNVGGTIMRDPLDMQGRSDYVIKPNQIRNPDKMKDYYSQYEGVVKRHEKISTCAECLVTRLPLPVELLSPHVHLAEVKSDSFHLESRQSLSWM